MYCRVGERQPPTFAVTTLLRPARAGGAALGSAVVLLLFGCGTRGQGRERTPPADVAAAQAAADTDAGPAEGDTVDGVLQPADDAETSDSAKESGCKPAPEQCDGVDNDCDGVTDEDFSMVNPGTGEVLPIGTACAPPWCPGGTVVCSNDGKKAECGKCGACDAQCQAAKQGQQAVKVSAVLAPADAKPSPYAASGGFVDVTASLPLGALTVDVSDQMHVPFGISGMAIDADADGDLDLVWCDGVHTAVLLKSDAPWQYTSQVLVQASDRPIDMAAMDSDGDGIPELLFAGDKLRRLVRQGNGEYVDTAAASGLVLPAIPQDVDDGHVQYLLPADVNQDGLLDLLVGRFSCNKGPRAVLAFVSRGEGGFQEQGEALGLGLSTAVWALMTTDYTGDGLQDLLVFNEGCPQGSAMALYEQQQPDAAGPMYKLKQMPPIWIAPAGPPFAFPMGAAAADVNGDGVIDYLLSDLELHGFVENGGKVDPFDTNQPVGVNMHSNFLLLSQPNGDRVDAGLPAGLWAPLSKTKHLMESWSPAWADLDHDGHLDLLLSHAFTLESWLLGDAGGMRPVAFRNDGTQHFTDLSSTWGLPEQHAGRSLVVADLDGDGDLDLLLGGQGVPPAVFRNDIQDGGHDLEVRLVGAASNVWGLGARLELQTSVRSMVIEHNFQAPSQSMATPVTHFALGAKEKPQKLQVIWPSGWISKVAMGQTSGTLEVQEPPLFQLSTRWSPKGAKPVVVTAISPDADGKPQPIDQPCSIELAPGSKGGWNGPTTCSGSTCTRTWQGGGALAGGSDAMVLGCGGQTWHIRPRIFY